MSPAAKAFWLRATRRAAGLEPEVARALLRAFATIRDSLSDVELLRLIQSGNVDRLVADMLNDDLMGRAFIPVRQRLRQTVERSFQYATNDLPKGGTIDGTIAVAFDSLNPRVIDAIRGLESDAINTLKGEVKEVVRAFVENGLRDGRPPAAIAREIRATVGLAPNQEAAVRNFRRMLETRDREALTRQLRDRRFDATLEKAFAGDGLSEVQIDRMTDGYRRKFVAFNATVNATTHTRDAYKLGQKLAWEDADAQGVIPDGFRLVKTWVHFDPQPDPRPEHIAMAGQTVPADQPYSNGDTYAGEGDPWNCKCLDRFHLERAA